MALPQPYLPNYSGQANQLAQLGQQFGENRRRNMLSEALPGAMSGDQNALLKLYKADPIRAAQVQRDVQAQKQESQKLTREQFDSAMQRASWALVNSQTPMEDYMGIKAGLIRQFEGMPEVQQRLMQTLPESWTPDLQVQAAGYLGKDMPSNEPYTLGPGQKRFGPGGQVIAEAPFKPESTPSGYRMGPDGTLQVIPGGPADPNNPINNMRTGKAPSGYQWTQSATGERSLQPIAGGPSDPSKAKLTEAESKGVIYLTRARAAEENLAPIENELLSVSGAAASRIPGGNFLQSGNYQKAKQAREEFLAAVLRKDTGAAITKEEFGLYGPMYFPEPGDRPEVVEQKRKARRIAMSALEAGLGDAAARVPEMIRKPSGGADPDIEALIEKYGRE